MKKTLTAESENALTAAKQAYEAAKAQREALRTPESMQAVKDTWNALEALTIQLCGKQKQWGTFACRAGQRQAAERRALATRRR